MFFTLSYVLPFSAMSMEKSKISRNCWREVLYIHLIWIISIMQK